MKKQYRPLFVILTVLLSVFLILETLKDRNLNQKLSAGETAPDFSAKEKNGTPIQLSSLKGKVVLLNFWASWCQPCLYEMPALVALNKKLRGDDFVILSINTDKGDLVNAQRVIEQFEVDFPIIFDQSNKEPLEMAYAVNMLPTNFLLDKNGRIAQKFLGAIEFSSPEFIEQIEALKK